MKIKTQLCAIAAMTALSLSAFAGNKPAPAFSEVGSDGKRYTVKTLTNGKPVLIMFFAAGCPHNVHGIEDMNRLQALLGGSVRLAGMTNLDAKQTKQFAAKHHAKFPILSDPDGKVIAAFGAVGGLDNALVLANGEVVKRWIGYDQATLRQFESELQKAGGPALKLNIDSLPKDRQAGCAFAMDMK